MISTGKWVDLENTILPKVIQTENEKQKNQPKPLMFSSEVGRGEGGGGRGGALYSPSIDAAVFSAHLMFCLGLSCLLHLP